MDYLRLASAILLPWLGGYFWLAALERRLDPDRACTLRQLGYGLFLGFAALQGIVLACNKLLGGVTFGPVALVLALLTLAGGVLHLRRPGTAGHDQPPVPETTGSGNTVSQVLFWLLIGWATLHLVLVAIEILHRPIFPWDAWLNWMYRAKAWFYSGQVFLMDSPIDWLTGSANAPYNVTGNHYPTLVPIAALWAATALGYWSETLVNLPVLCCGIALGCALYGECREYGLARFPAALAAYLLLSIPLVGTHLSLAGQADIWMTGFTGLGFAALLHGIIRHKPVRILLGLAMVAMGIATKMEGAVWFLAALLTLALARHTRTTLLVMLALVGLAALGWIMGITSLDLPLLGKLGVSDGRLHLPLLGTYRMQTFDLWDDYRDNFLLSGTWHLLWTLIPLSLIGLKLLAAGLLRKTILVFYLVLLAAQLLIFEGTDSGRWAEDWTAINRLPMHFAPALVFSLLIVGQALLARTRSNPVSRGFIAVPIASLVITLAGAMSYLQLAYPPGTEAAARVFDPHQMRTVVGVSRKSGEASVIKRYQNNIAIVSSGPIQLDTAGYGLARVVTGGANQKRATLFWRNGAGPDDLHSTQVSGRGTRWINLGEEPQWRGQVTEIGLVFYADGDEEAEFHGLEMRPYGLSSQLSKLAQDWTERTTWSQRSVHWLPAGARHTTMPLPLLLSAWLLVAMLIAAMTYRHAPGAYKGALFCAGLVWLILDARWTANSIFQARATLNAYPLASARALDFGDDTFTRELVEKARPEFGQAGKRAVVMAEEKDMRFRMLRAKYQALPAAVYVHEGPLSTLPARLNGHVLVIKQRYTDPSHRSATAEEYALQINTRGRQRATPVWDGPEGFLLKVHPVPAKPGS